MKRFKIVVISTNRADWLHCYAMLKSLIVEFDCSLVLIGDSEAVQDPKIQKLVASKKLRILSSKIKSKNESFDEILGAVPISIAKIFEESVDLAIVFGDRLEMLIASLCLYKERIKIAHIAGGETSLGSLDETYRNIITSISNYHFPLTEAGKIKLLRQGVRNDLIFRIGAPSLDLIPIHSKKRIEAVLKKYSLAYKDYLVLTYHSPTGKYEESANLIEFFSNLLEELSSKYNLVITESNLEGLGYELRKTAKKFIMKKNIKNVRYIEGFSGEDYLGLIAGASICIGNSSSGLYEAPLQKTPTINIGDRQEGRTHGPSVFNVKADTSEVMKMVSYILGDLDCEIDYSNPYFLPDSSTMLTKCLLQILTGKA